MNNGLIMVLLCIGSPLFLACHSSSSATQSLDWHYVSSPLEDVAKESTRYINHYREMSTRLVQDKHELLSAYRNLIAIAASEGDVDKVSTLLFDMASDMEYSDGLENRDAVCALMKVVNVLIQNSDSPSIDKDKALLVMDRVNESFCGLHSQPMVNEKVNRVKDEEIKEVEGLFWGQTLPEDSADKPVPVTIMIDGNSFCWRIATREAGNLTFLIEQAELLSIRILDGRDILEVRARHGGVYYFQGQFDATILRLQ